MTIFKWHSYWYTIYWIIDKYLISTLPRSDATHSAMFFTSILWSSIIFLTKFKSPENRFYSEKRITQIHISALIYNDISLFKLTSAIHVVVTQQFAKFINKEICRTLFDSVESKNQAISAPIWNWLMKYETVCSVHI